MRAKQEHLPCQRNLAIDREGTKFAEIAQIRQRTLRAVVSLVADLIERGDTEFQPNWLAPERYEQIAACRQLGMDRLKPLKKPTTRNPYEEIVW